MDDDDEVEPRPDLQTTSSDYRPQLASEAVPCHRPTDPSSYTEADSRFGEVVSQRAEGKFASARPASTPMHGDERFG